MSPSRPPVSGRLPLVSVVTPSHNTAAFIGATIASVLAQSFADWELLVVEDGSSDASAEVIVASAGDDLGRRVRLERNAQPCGPAQARNRAISLARGRYIAFLDSDDLWYPAKLERQLAFMERSGAAVSHTGYELMNEAGRLLERKRVAPAQVGYRSLLGCNVIGCLTGIYDRGRVGTVLLPDIGKRQDHGLWLRILRQGHAALCLPEVLAAYRLRSGSLSRGKLEVARYQWRLYRQVERLSLPVSAWCFARYAANGVLRRREGPMRPGDEVFRPAERAAQPPAPPA